MINDRKLVNLIWMLVSAGWSRTQIVDTLLSIKETSFFEVERLIAQVRLAHDEAAFELSRKSNESAIEDDNVPAVSSEIPLRIHRLLKEEALMTTAAAVTGLTSGLRQLDRGRAKDLPKFAKQSLMVWVEKAMHIFSAGELLYVATRLRNQAVHGTPLDWTLRKNES